MAVLSQASKGGHLVEAGGPGLDRRMTDARELAEGSTWGRTVASGIATPTRASVAANLHPAMRHLDGQEHP